MERPLTPAGTPHHDEGGDLFPASARGDPGSGPPQETPLRITVISPVYNDWDAFHSLSHRIRDSVKCARLQIIAVDDGSPRARPRHHSSYSTLTLTRNLGHQKAIAVGLAYVVENVPSDLVIVMDADGEDRPEDLPTLLETARTHPGSIVFAERAKRHEGVIFRFFYQVYTLLFRLLTGHRIAFGNFCLVPGILLPKLVNVSEIWNHFAGGVLRSRLPHVAVPIERGRRLHGESRMTFTTLVLHGLSGVTVYVDHAAVRLLVASLGLVAAASLGLMIVVGIRTLTTLAIPGWATSAALGLAIILMQAVLASILLVFMVLNYRTSKLFIPVKDYRDYLVSNDLS